MASSTSNLAASTTGTEAGNRVPVCFLDLPPEIRNRMYHDALVEPHAILVHASSPFIQEPALLCTNARIRKEALAIFYGANIFESTTFRSFTIFLQQFPWEKQGLLRTVLAVAALDVLAARDILGTPKFFVKWMLSSRRMSWDLFHDKALKDSVRVSAEQHLQAIKHSNIARKAVRLPLFYPGKRGGCDVHWVTVEQYDKTDVHEREGRVVLVEFADDAA